MAIWDDVIGSVDRSSFAKGYSADQYVGFGERPAVLVVDMARAFVEDAYPTGNSRLARPAVAAIARLLAAAREAQVPVLYTTYSAREFAFGWARWKGSALSDPLMHRETAFEITPELAPQAGRAGDRQDHAERASSARRWRACSTFLGVDTCIVTGMVTSGCVRATVVDAFSHNYRVVVPEECVADRGELSHKVNLFDIHMKYGDVRPLADVLEYLARTPAGAPAAR